MLWALKKFPQFALENWLRARLVCSSIFVHFDSVILLLGKRCLEPRTFNCDWRLFSAIVLDFAALLEVLPGTPENGGMTGALPPDLSQADNGGRGAFPQQCHQLFYGLSRST